MNEKKTTTERVAELSKEINKWGVVAGVGMIGIGLAFVPTLIGAGAGFTTINAVSYYVSEEARKGQVKKRAIKSE